MREARRANHSLQATELSKISADKLSFTSLKRRKTKGKRFARSQLLFEKPEKPAPSGADKQTNAQQQEESAMVSL